MLHVEIEKGEVTKTTGNTCIRGEQYAKLEVTNPTRIVTTTVLVLNGDIPVVSVKTSEDVPKDKIKECMKALKGIAVTAPVHIGDIILENIAGTNVNVIATKAVNSTLIHCDNG